LQESDGLVFTASSRVGTGAEFEIYRCEYGIKQRNILLQTGLREQSGRDSVGYEKNDGYKIEMRVEMEIIRFEIQVL